MRRTVLLKQKRHLAGKLIVTAIGFCCCLQASDTYTQGKKSDSYSLNREQVNFPIYRDNIFYHYVKGRVFFVVGTSSAGKSSIIKELTKYIPRAKKKEFLRSGYDDVQDTLILKSVRCKFAEKLDFVTRKDLLYCISATQTMPQENIFKILDVVVLFKKHRQLLLDEEWYNTISQLDSCIFSAQDVLSSVASTLLNIANGKNIILDVVTYMPFIFVLESNFIRYDSYNICVYSPPSYFNTTYNSEVAKIAANRR